MRSIATQEPPTPAASAITAESVDCALADFDTCGDPQLEAMREAGQMLLFEIADGAPPRWLSLLGTSGAGKTFLADLIRKAITKYQLCRSEVTLAGVLIDGVVRMNWEIGLEKMLSEKAWGRLSDVSRAKFALVDDIGTQLVPRNISAPKLASLCERRLNKWTIFTANLGLGEIGDQLDKRIASRMLRGGSVVVDVNVVDYNLRPRETRK